MHIYTHVHLESNMQVCYYEQIYTSVCKATYTSTRHTPTCVKCTRTHTHAHMHTHTHTLTHKNNLI